MKIVVTDGFTMNPGDLSWNPIKNLGESTIFDDTSKEQLVDRLKDCEIAVINKVVLSKEVLKQLPNLKMITLTATGYNNVDLEQAKEQEIVVCNVPAYSTNSVAQMVFAHILAFTNRVAEHSDSVKKGDWEKSERFCYTVYPLQELSGKTMGVVGYGSIGKAITKIAIAFGMKVLVNTRTTPKTLEGVKLVEREELFQKSDFIALAAPLTDQTKNIINSETVKKMKSTAFLVNTGRGPLVNEAELAQALDEKSIAGAGVDVLSQEPPADGSPLINSETCRITPHISWASFEARDRLMGSTIKNINSFLNKNIVNCVNC